jgi:hypothetical protein
VVQTVVMAVSFRYMSIIPTGAPVSSSFRRRNYLNKRCHDILMFSVSYPITLKIDKWKVYSMFHCILSAFNSNVLWKDYKTFVQLQTFSW